MSIVVVEGPDGAGKTTLIKNLRAQSKRYFVSLQNSGIPQNVLNVQCVCDWLARMAIGRVPLVCDRLSLISEPIYGEIVRNENILEGTYTIQDVETFLLDNVDRVIYCRPPTSAIIKGLESEQQLEGVVERIQKLTERYDWVMQMISHGGVRVITYDWTGIELTKKFGGTPRDLEDLFFGEARHAR